MSRRLLGSVVAAAATAGALLVTLPATSGAAGNQKFVCNIDPITGTALSGTYFDVVVPPNGYCLLDGATVTHDVIAQHNSSLAVQNTTIGHDLTASQPALFATGEFATAAGGPVNVGHDLNVSGSDDGSGGSIDVCDTKITHDLSINGTRTFDEIQVGDVGGEIGCSGAPSAPDSVGNNVNISGNKPAHLDIGNDQIGNNLSVNGNQATNADGGGAFVDVSDNTVGGNANCNGNKPAPALGGDGDGDGPNTVSGHNNGCP